MNTWLTHLVRDANERAFDDRELDRLTAYTDSLPARLDVSDELRQLEGELVASMPAEMRKKFPERTMYTKRVVQDLLEALRHLSHAVLCDEPELFRRRWVDHLCKVISEARLDPTTIRDFYQVVQERAELALSLRGRELVRPILDSLMQSFPAYSRSRS